MATVEANLVSISGIGTNNNVATNTNMLLQLTKQLTGLSSEEIAPLLRTPAKEAYFPFHAHDECCCK